MPERNPSPKARLLANAPGRSAHSELFGRDDMRYSIDMALLEYQRRLSIQNDGSNTDLAAANYNRLVGAQEFVQILLNLGEEPRMPVPQKPIGNLSHG